MSLNNNMKHTFSLSSPCTVDESSASNAVFKSRAYNKYFVNVNNKFLGTFDDESAAKARAMSYAQERCLTIKRTIQHFK